MTAADFARWIAAYEALARGNRPDWAAFVAEARADVYDIMCEVAEHAAIFEGRISVVDILSDDDADVLYDAVKAWVDSL